jgi:hypothetical protein
MAKRKSWKNFEESTYQTSTRIFPNAKVRANQEVKGSISGAMRQIDVKVGDVDFLDIECKDHGRPVDTPKVEQFANKLRDEGAGKGAIVSNSGFTKSALRTAAFYKIEPAILVDKGHSGASKAIIQAPVVARALYIDGVRYGLSNSSVNGYFEATQTVWDMKLDDGSGRNIYELLRDVWNSGEYDIRKPGAYKLAFNGVPLHSLHGATVEFDEVAYEYVVKEDTRLGKVGVEKARGIYNVRTQVFTTAEDIVFEPIITEHITDWAKLTEENRKAAGAANLSLTGIVPLPEVAPNSHEPTA